MQYVGVVLAITDKIMRRIYNGNFILQVWKKGGQKVYERVMQGEVKVWNCYADILVYLSPAGDEHDDCITIVDLKNPDAAPRHVRNFSKGREKKRLPFKFVFYGNNQIWLGSKNIICAAPIPDADFADGVVEVLPRNVCMYDPGTRVWGFFPMEQSHRTGCFDVAFETDDNQLDFSSIECANMEPDSFVPVVKQKQDVLPKTFDTQFQIQEAHVLYTWENTCYAMTLLEEGMADFYWNGARLCSNSQRNKIDEICFSESHFYYKRKQETVYNQVDLALGSQINIDMSQECDLEFDKKVAMFNNVKTFFNIFPQFSLIKNTCYVAHGRILSQYDIINNRWNCHLLWDQKIRFLFRYKTKDGYVPCLMLEDGQVFNDFYTAPEVQQREVDMSRVQNTVKINDEILRIFPDQEDAEKVFFMTKKPDGTAVVKILRGAGITEIEGIENCN